MTLDQLDHSKELSDAVFIWLQVCKDWCMKENHYEAAALIRDAIGKLKEKVQ